MRRIDTAFSLGNAFGLSVGSGIEVVVSKSVRPIKTDQIEIPADRISERPTGSRSLSKYTLGLEEIRATSRPDTELNLDLICGLSDWNSGGGGPCSPCEAPWGSMNVSKMQNDCTTSF
jgi:hypothetical protein